MSKLMIPEDVLYKLIEQWQEDAKALGQYKIVEATAAINMCAKQLTGLINQHRISLGGNSHPAPIV